MIMEIDSIIRESTVVYRTISECWKEAEERILDYGKNLELF